MSKKVYVAMWIRPDGEPIIKKFKADGFGFAPNGFPVLINYTGPSNVYTIQPTGDQEGPARKEEVAVNLSNTALIYEETSLVEEA